MANSCQPRCSIAVIILRSDTGTGVPIVCAKRLTRSSSIIQRMSRAASLARTAGGSAASAAW